MMAVNNVMLLFLQLRHNFPVNTAQLLKTGHELILKSRKTVQSKQKAEKAQSEKKERALCVCLRVCVF